MRRIANRPKPFPDSAQHGVALGAETDLEAIELYLSHVAARNIRTAREYLREVRRLATWLDVSNIGLQQLTYRHLIEYFALLSDEPALERLADDQPTNERREQIEQVFSLRTHRRRGAAMIGAQRARSARAVIAAMLHWLASAGHLPPIAVPRLAHLSSEHALDTDDRLELARATVEARKLPAHLWRIIDGTIESLRWDLPDEAFQRAVLTWLRWSGERRSAFTGALASHISVESARSSMGHDMGDEAARTFHFWKVRQKGKKYRKKPINTNMIDAYHRYLLSRGVPFGSGFASLGDAPLFMVGDRAADGRDIYQCVRQVVDLASERVKDLADRELLKRVTPHWFRHRRAFELEQKHPLSLVAQFLGHASISTTQIYSSAADVDLADAIYG